MLPDICNDYVRFIYKHMIHIKTDCWEFLDYVHMDVMLETPSLLNTTNLAVDHEGKIFTA